MELIDSVGGSIPSPPSGFGEMIRRRFEKVTATVTGKGSLAAAALAGVYVAHRYGLFGKTKKTVMNVLPFIRWGMTKLGVDPPVVVAAPKTRKNCLESAREGSHEVPMPTPKCQVLIGEMISGEFHAFGNGVRIKNWLVAPAHVLFQVKSPVVKGRQSWLEITTEEYEDLDTDLVAIRMSDRQWSTIGASICSIAHVTYTAGHYVSVVGVTGKGTCGVLRDDSTVFGRMVYDGTTLAGYSGAGYMAGPQLVGVHTNGGAVNGGYSASYIMVILNLLDREKPEDSDDWLRDMMKRNKRIRIDKRWMDLDDVRIQVDGRYAVVSRDALRSAMGDDFDFDDDGDTPVAVKRGYSYGNSRAAQHDLQLSAKGRRYQNEGISLVSAPPPEEHSQFENDMDVIARGLVEMGEEMSSSSGASSSLVKSPETLELIGRELIRHLKECSTKRLRAFAQLLEATGGDSSILESLPKPKPRKRKPNP